MSTMTSPGTSAVLRTEARLFGRELGSLFWILVFPTALLCVLGAIPAFRDPDPELGGLSVVDLYVPVSVLLAMIMAAIMAMPPVIFAYRETGVLRRLRTTPVRPSALLFAQVALHAAAVVASAVLVIAVGRLVFGTPLPGSWLGYLLASLLALSASFSTGAVVTALAPNGRVGTAIATIVFFPSMFTAGVWVPVQALGGWLRDAVGLTPLGAASEALNDAMLGDFPDPRHLLVVAAWTLVLSAVSVRTFRWE
jgi:ABC-2 type transport system permease protein